MRTWLEIFAFVFSLATLESYSLAGLVVYDFANQPGNQAFQAASVVDSHVIATGVVRGTGLNGTSAANSFSSSGWNDLSASDYVEFGLSVESGYKANLTTLTFSSRSSATGPGTMVLRSNSDGYSSNLVSWAQAATDSNVTANLVGLGDPSGSVLFRILTTSNQSAGGGIVGSTGTFRLGTVTQPGGTLLTINGSVSPLASVPEPSSILLVFAAGLFLFALRIKTETMGLGPWLHHAAALRLIQRRFAALQSRRDDRL